VARGETARPAVRRKKGPRSKAAYEGENRAFLTALARTGNVKQAAAETGFWAETMHRRKARDPALAARWEAAIDTAREALARPAAARLLPDGTSERRARGDELVVLSGVGGRLQVRRARKGTLTQAAVDCFLAQLASSANVTHAAERAGFDSSNFYAMAQKDRVFAQAWREALETGYEQLETALLQGMLDPERGDWLEESLTISGAITAEQALHLLNQHRNTVRLQGELADKRRRGPDRSSLEFAMGRLEQTMRRFKLLPDPLDDEDERTRPG
jgi:hypothetical protein